MALATRMISILDKTIRQNRGYFEETDFAIDYHDLLKLKKRKVTKKEQNNFRTQYVLSYVNHISAETLKQPQAHSTRDDFFIASHHRLGSSVPLAQPSSCDFEVSLFSSASTPVRFPCRYRLQGLALLSAIICQGLIF